MDCDPPIQLLETMLKKLKSVEKEGGKIDAIIVPGDLVAHGVPIDPATAGSGNYELLKKTLAAVADTLNKYFPDSLVIPSMGNNDGKYHYRGIDLADKSDYYTFFFNHWFSAHPLNSKLPELPQVEKTFLSAGYYRVDLTSNLSILAVNTLYLNKKNDFTNQSTEAQDQIDWLRANLATGKSTGRKFLLTYHIYPGAKYDGKAKDLFLDTYNEAFFELLATYRDSIVLEVTAHDHYSDVRYHTSADTTTPTFYYHNMFVSPGVTPINGQNPGVAMFEVDEKTLSPQNLQLYFIELSRTYGWQSVPEDVSLIPFRQVSLSKEYGLYSLNAGAIKDFKNALDSD